MWYPCTYCVEYCGGVRESAVEKYIGGSIVGGGGGVQWGGAVQLGLGGVQWEVYGGG